MKRPNRQAPATGNKQLDLILRELYDYVNAISDGVAHTSVQGDQSHTRGDGGELRLVKGDDKKYYLQARFKDGWVTTPQDFLKFQNTSTRTPPVLFAGGTNPNGVPVELTVEWGVITGLLSNQVDLQNELDSALAMAVAL
jgi:hypothetical protein